MSDESLELLPPLFSEIAQKTVLLLGIPPDAIRLQIASQ